MLKTIEHVERMEFLKDEEKQLLFDHYLDIEWPQDIGDLRCVSCQQVAISHYKSNCQHLFCNNCRRVFSDGEQQRCPQCHQYVTQLVDQDLDVDFKVQILRIFCPNKKYGCNYEDQLKNIPKHLMACVDTLEVALPVEYTEANRIKAVVKHFKKLDDAIRELKEQVYSKYKEQAKKIDEVNDKLNGLRERMRSMEKTSEESAFDTKYAEEFKAMKSIMESVKERVQHNELLRQQTVEKMHPNMEVMRTKMLAVTREMKVIQKSVELNHLKTENYEWTINDVAKNVMKEEWSIESEVFKFTGYTYEIRAMLVNNDGLSIVLQFQEGNTFDKFLNKNGFTAVKYIVKDQSNNIKKEDIISGCNLRFYDCFGQKSWIFESVLPTAAMLSSPYVKNDCIKMRILFEPPTIDRSYVSNNGLLKWRVDEYKAWKVEVFYRDTCSPSFYTSPQGYRVKTQLGINDKGTMLVVVHFLTGEHDDWLSINFPHKTTATLFNQSDPSKNLVKCKQREDVNLYAIEVESISFIEENGFIKDDSLLCSVLIEPRVSLRR